MRAVHTVHVERWTPGATDAHGNAVQAWSAPEELKVYAIAPRGTEEPGEDRLAVVTGLTLYTPPSVVVGPLDRVLVNGVRWVVEGETADYTRGPFAWSRGKTFALKKAEG